MRLSALCQAVTSWELGPNGLLYDREWALVDPDGRTLSQRRHPRLTQIRPLVDPTAGVHRAVRRCAWCCILMHCNASSVQNTPSASHAVQQLKLRRARFF